MKLFPAIDLYEKKAVRLKKGDYSQMTVYSDDPVEVAVNFEKCGAEYLHAVDLEGAKFGTSPNIGIIEKIVKTTSLKIEVGGGIRNEEIAERYINAGVYRIILGTAAVENPDFLNKMVKKYGSKVAVGVDIKDGFVATHGWLESSGENCFEFCGKLEKMNVSAVIVTDVSKDGLLSGANTELYRKLSGEIGIDIVASGGISTIDNIIELKKTNISGAILGKALYTGDIDLKTALAEVK